jgi:anti-sigma-K factor RskA
VPWPWQPAPSRQGQVKHEARWEGVRAGIGLLATVMFVLAFIVFMTTNLTGTPLSSVVNTQQAPAHLVARLNAYRSKLPLMSLMVRRQ